jgi:hypothetical protein
MLPPFRSCRWFGECRYNGRTSSSASPSDEQHGKIYVLGQYVSWSWAIGIAGTAFAITTA